MESLLAERAPDVAFYSEDRGMVTPAGHDPLRVLIVDPIDGTRPAWRASRSACVGRRGARGREPTMGDVPVGCIVEIKSGAGFVAERGAGLDPLPQLSANTTGADVLELRPARRLARQTIEVLAELIDASRSAAPPSTSDRRPTT
jgi:myo-inositol-1(or 4)-monophosphatase